jgi:predicted branched-subunit amino acid permease
VAAAPPVAARWLSTLLIFGGSAQLVTMELLDAGSPLLLGIGAGLVTNARVLAYSASLAPYWRDQPRWFRLLGAALIIDPTWAMAQRDRARGHRRPDDHRAYFLGEAGTLAAGWFGAVSLGVLAGARLTDVIGRGGVLALAAPLSLAALVAPQLASRPAVVVAAVAALAGWVGADLPAGIGLLLAVAAATAAGALVDRRAGPAEEPV